MTTALISINTAMFAYEAWLSSQGDLEAFILQHALVASRLLHALDLDQLLTVMSSMFLHGSVLHVLGNVWFLWVFGNNVEDRLGPVKFTALYVLSGLVAAAAQLLADPGSHVPMLGASGAMCGVVGAYLVLFPGGWIVALIPWFVPIAPIPAVVFLVLWFLLQAANGVGSLMAGGGAGGVAWWAHVGGFIAGIVLTLQIKKMFKIRR